jgi:hypothetical protein
MIAEKNNRITGSVQRDQIGKVFLVVSPQGMMMRQCLICEGVFTHKEAREHFRVACYPRT